MVTFLIYFVVELICTWSTHRTRSIPQRERESLILKKSLDKLNILGRMVSQGILEIGKNIFVFLIQLILNQQLIKTVLILSTASTEHALSMCIYYDLYVYTTISMRALQKKDVSNLIGPLEKVHSPYQWTVFFLRYFILVKCSMICISLSCKLPPQRISE